MRVRIQGNMKMDGPDLEGMDPLSTALGSLFSKL